VGAEVDGHGDGAGWVCLVAVGCSYFPAEPQR
jgi:hypothetical protein